MKLLGIEMLKLFELIFGSHKNFKRCEKVKIICLGMIRPVFVTGRWHQNVYSSINNNNTGIPMIIIVFTATWCVFVAGNMRARINLSSNSTFVAVAVRYSMECELTTYKVWFCLADFNYIL